VTVHLIDTARRRRHHAVWPDLPASLSPATRTMSPSAAMAVRALSSATPITRCIAHPQTGQAGSEAFGRPAIKRCRTNES